MSPPRPAGPPGGAAPSPPGPPCSRSRRRSWRSPAQSPLPGHLLATLGPAGHLAALVLLIAAGLALAGSLLIRPPAGAAAAARRLALGLAVMFALSPDTRFGYFAYPAGLCGWLALSRPGFAATLTGIRDCAGVMPPGAGLRPGKVMARRRVDLGAQ